MTRPRLIDVARDTPPAVDTSDCLDLVHVPTVDKCPNCQANLTATDWAQPALFRFGGYGETTGRTFRRCAACRWQSATDEHALNPRTT